MVRVQVTTGVLQHSAFHTSPRLLLTRPALFTDTLAVKPYNKSKPTLVPGTKRSYAPIFDDEQNDSENVDPSLLSAKRSKCPDGTPSKKNRPMFTLNTTSGNDSTKTRSTLNHSSVKPSTPVSPLDGRFPGSNTTTNTSSFTLPSGPSSAPAGCSPKHKRIGILSKKRSSLSPFRRIDPPTFGTSKSSSSSTGPAFSIDAALSGTLSSYAAPPPSVKPKQALTIAESMPKGWFFAIHEDTPDQEATNIMEHSACTLDISSDDEAGPSKKANDDRGKENVPPPDHHEVQIQASAVAGGQPTTAGKARRAFDADAMKDVGDDRLPLGALPAEDFYGLGLDAKSVEVIGLYAEETIPEEGEGADADDEFENDENAAPAVEETSVAAQSGRDGAGEAPAVVIAVDKVDNLP